MESGSSVPRGEELEPHPIALMFPDGSPDENRELARDIKANGLRHEIWLYQDAINGGPTRPYILDGRRRNDACIIEQIQPRYRTYVGDDPLGFAMSLNFHRRHLTISDRKRIAAAMLKANPLQTDRGVAKKTGIDKGTVAKVREQVQAEPLPSNGDFRHKDSSGPGSSSEQVPHIAEGGEPAGVSDAAPPAPAPRVEAGLKKDGTPRQQRGRKPAAASKAATVPKEIKPKPIVNERDAWVTQTAAQFKKDAQGTIEAIGMIVRDLPNKQALALKFFNVVGYTPVGGDISL